MIYRFNCKRCGHEWASKQDRPKVCPKCKNPYWDIPKNSSRAIRAITVDAKLLKKVELESKQKIKNNKWGRWKYNPANHCLEIETQKYGGIFHYQVDLDRCDTGARLLDWIYQVAGKSWISADDIADLVYAVDDILGSVQGALCSGGENLRFDVSKYLIENVDPLFKRKPSIKR